MPPDICPQCGAMVPSDARACPECGSDEETGWSDRATAQRLGVADDEFDYDEFVKSEFGEPEKSPRPRGLSPLWWIVAIVLALMVLLAATGGIVPLLRVILPQK